jgi:hypothetical protein
MDFWKYTTIREANHHQGVFRDADIFYDTALTIASQGDPVQSYIQLCDERIWEQQRKPYYRVWPGIVPMLTRLNLAFNSSLIRLPLPALCVRFPKIGNPLRFKHDEKEIDIRCMLMCEIKEGELLSILIDVGERHCDNGVELPVYTYRNFRRQDGLDVEQSLRESGNNEYSDAGIIIPADVISDCVRICCTLCLLEQDPSLIEPDVLSRDRLKFEETAAAKFVAKAHRRGKIGWNVGRRIEVIPHYRRPHLALVWTGQGRSVPKIVARRGSIVHRRQVEQVPTAFGE